MIACRIFGHNLGPFPSPVPEWRVLGNYAALIDVYRCRRCGEPA